MVDVSNLVVISEKQAEGNWALAGALTLNATKAKRAAAKDVPAVRAKRSVHATRLSRLLGAIPHCLPHGPREVLRSSFAVLS